MTEFQTRIQEAFHQAQTKATARAKEWEKEARKVLETLGDRAPADFREFLLNAQKRSYEQLGALGVELEKLGKKLQEIAAKSAPAATASVNGATPPAAHPN